MELDDTDSFVKPHLLAADGHARVATGGAAAEQARLAEVHNRAEVRFGSMLGHVARFTRTDRRIGP